MVSIAIDQGRCAKDGICAHVCPAAIFVQQGKLTVPDLVHQERCISCGQCVSVTWS